MSLNVKSCRFSRMQLELPFVTHFTARHSTQRDDRHGADRTATGVSRHRAVRASAGVRGCGPRTHSTQNTITVSSTHADGTFLQSDGARRYIISHDIGAAPALRSHRHSPSGLHKEHVNVRATLLLITSALWRRPFTRRRWLEGVDHIPCEVALAVHCKST